jgi:hypothetical protein
LPSARLARHRGTGDYQVYFWPYGFAVYPCPSYIIRRIRLKAIDKRPPMAVSSFPLSSALDRFGFSIHYFQKYSED